MPAESPGRAEIPALARDAADAALSPPRLPETALGRVALAIDAARLCMPVALAVPAAGRLLIARALHARAAREGPLMAAVGSHPSLAALPAGCTLYVDVTAVAPETLLALEAILDDAEVWLLAGFAPGEPAPSGLAPRLAPLTLEVPPLAQRGHELPALARWVVERLAARAGRVAPRLTDGALARLADHSWPGDLAQLEAVLARALLSATGAIIDSPDLALDTPAPSEVSLAPLAERATDGRLEYLLAELAHELRNPLVTVKMFAEHLPEVLGDAELRARFSALAGEAVGRMDGLLENVLDFARLPRPQREPIALGPFLDRILGEVEPELAARALRVRRTGAEPGACAGDPEHLGYALRNLLAGVIREVAPRQELLLETTANGVVSLRFAAGGEAAARLRQVAAPHGAARLGDPTMLPLPFTLARATLERCGGTVSVEPEAGGGASLVVHLPTG